YSGKQMHRFIEKERIKSIDVLKGRPLGLENVGVIVVRLRAPGESRETAQLHQVETPVTSPSGVIQADRQPLLRDKVPAAGEVVEIPVKVLLRERVPAAGTVVETPARVLLRERVPLTKEGAGAAGGQLREIPVTSLPRRVPPQ
ncbi:MAG: hypothetical protein KJZ47_14990, partial [Gemmatimonadales bacterium]|nr:hypothetical protein [Gemmatimonadales bacterium]